MISYAVTNTFGCTVTVTKILSATAPHPGSATTGIETATAQPGEVMLYPNPTNGTINIRADVAGVFNLYSVDGRALGQYKINEGITNVTLPNELASGVYVGRFTGDDGSITLFKVIKQ